jgi:predicted DCC family thiol-disulfide oxidoreductase YuxK
MLSHKEAVMQQNQHLVFFDGECGICDRMVRFLIKADKYKKLQFAPLQGETAKKFLVGLPKRYRGEDTIVLLENWNKDERRFYILGKATLRIFWLLGGWWLLIGWFSFVPGVFYNWIYRIFARHRHQLFPLKECGLTEALHKDRFLP